MKKLLASLVFVLVVAALATSVAAQVGQNPPGNQDRKEFVLNEDKRGGTRLQLKYTHVPGPDEPDQNPYYIQEPFTPEKRGGLLTTSLANAQGNLAGATQGAAVTTETGPGAILSGRSSGGQASSPHQEARRNLKKLIKQLG